ncbi:phosphotransferase family protein [Patulibacter defluvii]|uniref:phosphotransferase family protein n=1 Tax=Patulibacter defluvii TaxID=3095358 RepID=UPI002A752C2B|nr:phosphotransferase family protein [Patulibacter sp. DM4]
MSDPALPLAPLTAFLDAHGLGRGPVAAVAIGEGHSNLTYLLRRRDRRMVLRRPPLGPLAPSAHDVLREARLLRALRPAGVRVPEVLAVGDDPATIGAPFYLMPFLDGHVLTDRVPAALAGPARAAEIGERLVDALVELHAVDPGAEGLAGLGRPDGYLDRQLRRFGALLAEHGTRPLPDLEATAERLRATRSASGPATVVHGDYRLGNVMLATDGGPLRLTAILDWELATIGDPLADLGYLTAMWARPGDPEDDPMLALGAVTRGPGFADREQLAARYAERSGRDVAGLRWYQALAVWKAAIFLEVSYGRHLAGATTDPYFARLGAGVPRLARRARALIEETPVA